MGNKKYTVRGSRSRKLKISFDLDGTCWAHMVFFRHMMIDMQNRGHQVGILTGHRDSCKNRDISLLRKRGFPEPDFYFGRTKSYMPKNGAHFKSMAIAREGIDLHFDDYDYNNQSTIQLFGQLGMEDNIIRMKAKVVVDSEGNKIHYE